MTSSLTIGPLDYAVPVAPSGYACNQCGVHGPKLWRCSEYSGALLCCGCAGRAAHEDVSTMDAAGMRCPLDGGSRTDQIGWYLPAVPTADGTTFWGYTSVPEAAVLWWRSLPLGSPASRPEGFELGESIRTRDGSPARVVFKHEHPEPSPEDFIDYHRLDPEGHVEGWGWAPRAEWAHLGRSKKRPERVWASGDLVEYPAGVLNRLHLHPRALRRLGSGEIVSLAGRPMPPEARPVKKGPPYLKQYVFGVDAYRIRFTTLEGSGGELMAMLDVSLEGFELEGSELEGSELEGSELGAPARAVGYASFHVSAEAFRWYSHHFERLIEQVPGSRQATPAVKHAAHRLALIRFFSNPAHYEIGQHYPEPLEGHEHLAETVLQLAIQPRPLVLSRSFLSVPTPIPTPVDDVVRVHDFAARAAVRARDRAVAHSPAHIRARNHRVVEWLLTRHPPRAALDGFGRRQGPAYDALVRESLSILEIANARADPHRVDLVRDEAGHPTGLTTAPAHSREPRQ